MTDEMPTRFPGYFATVDGRIISLKWGRRRELRLGTSSPYGHKTFTVCIDGIASSHSAHRAIWEAFYGAIPDGMEIDHIDRDPTNNALTNLRLATRQQNARNNSGHRRRKSGHSGVTFHKRIGKWQAVIRMDNKLKHLGYYATESEATSVRLNAEQQLYGEYAPRWT